MKNIAIIGAGMTGLSLAYNLQEHNITIFDKSWRPGGRVSTRKQDNYLFYFRARQSRKINTKKDKLPLSESKRYIQISKK